MQIEELFVSILNMSITASYAIVAVIILRLLLKRASKWIICVLWGIASFRLIFPFSLESMLSVFSVIPSTDTVTPEILYSEAPTIHSGIPALNTTVNPVISQSMAPAADASVNPLQVIAYIAGIVWAVGIAALLVYSIVTYIKLRRKTMTATLLKNNVYQSENVVSPFLLGFIRPKIFVSYSTTEPELSHVISHENAHIRRRDYLLKPLASLILALHWFNPLVWVAYILFCRDIELACDEKVIKGMSVDERKSYSEALLGLSMRSCKIPACPLAFGEVSVKERVKKTLSYKKPTFWIIIVAIAACVVTAVCLLTDPLQTSESDAIQELDSTNINSNTDTSDKMQEPDSTNIISNTDTTDGTINDVSELYGTYHPTEVIYVNPLSSFYPFDLETAPYYTLAENGLAIITPGKEDAYTNNEPLYTRSTLTQIEFDEMFMMDFDKPDISEYESIERIALTNEFSLFIVGTDLWLVDTNGGEQVWLIYKLEPSTPYSLPQGGKLTMQNLIRIVEDKGSKLSWNDFEQFDRNEIGSGLYIWQVPIDQNFCVLIGGGNSDMEPMYVRLNKLSTEGTMTDQYLDLLEENADVQGYVNSFAYCEEELEWRLIPTASVVFPALPIVIDLPYSTVDITVDNGTLYHRVGGYTPNSEQTYTYNSGEVIYWSPLLGDTIEDIADSCTLSFSIKNAQEVVIAEGKIYIQEMEPMDDYSHIYSLDLIEAPNWLHLAVNPNKDLWHSFVLTPK